MKRTFTFVLATLVALVVGVAAVSMVGAHGPTSEDVAETTTPGVWHDVQWEIVYVSCTMPPHEFWGQYAENIVDSNGSASRMVLRIGNAKALRTAVGDALMDGGAAMFTEGVSGLAVEGTLRFGSSSGKVQLNWSGFATTALQGPDVIEQMHAAQDRFGAFISAFTPSQDLLSFLNIASLDYAVALGTITVYGTDYDYSSEGCSPEAKE